jgi:hypothetical protein
VILVAKETVLVVDRGSFLLKLYKFEIHGNNNNGRWRNVTFNLIAMKYVHNEKFSNNIIGNEIDRFMETHGKDVERIIYLLGKNDGSNVVLINSEFFSDQKKMQKSTEAEAKKIQDKSETTLNWQYEEFTSSQNFVRTMVHMCSLSAVKEIFDTLGRYSKLKINIVDPSVAMMDIVPKFGDYAILDVGHENMSIAYYHEGFLSKVSANAKIAGQFVEEDLRQIISSSGDLFYRDKHSIGISDLVSEGMNFKNMFTQKIEEEFGAYSASTGRDISGYIIIGGMANLQLEEFIANEISTRRYIENITGFENEFAIDCYYRNFMFNAIAGVSYFYSDREKIIDLVETNKLFGRFNKLLRKFQAVAAAIILLWTMALLVNPIADLTFGRRVKELEDNLARDESSYSASVLETRRTELNDLTLQIENTISEIQDIQTEQMNSARGVRFFDLTQAMGEVKPNSIFINTFQMRTMNNFDLVIESVDGFDLKVFSDSLISNNIFEKVLMYDSSIVTVRDVPVYKMSFLCTSLSSRFISYADLIEKYYLDDVPVGMSVDEWGVLH